MQYLYSGNLGPEVLLEILNRVETFTELKASRILTCILMDDSTESP